MDSTYELAKLESHISGSPYKGFNGQPTSSDLEKLRRRIQNNTAFGALLEEAFLEVTENLLEYFSSDVIEIVTNYAKDGYDIYIYIIPLDVWIPVELKNYHTHYDHTESMIRDGFFDKYNRAHPGKIQRSKILHEFLIIAGDNLTARAQYRIQRDKSTTLVSSNVCFEESPTEEQEMEYITFLSEVFERIKRYIETILDNHRMQMFRPGVSIWLKKHASHCIIIDKRVIRNVYRSLTPFSTDITPDLPPD